MRSTAAVSRFSELPGPRFREVIGDSLDPSRASARSSSAPARFTTIFWPPGKPRATRKTSRWCVSRNSIRSRAQQVTDVLARYGANTELVWCQEEPRNMGAWRSLAGRFKDIGRNVKYVGRARNASPAVGSNKRHAEEQKRLVEEALK